MIPSTSTAGRQTRRVLIVSLAFPPAPQVGALRVAKLAAYLPRAGWDPLVLTLPTRHYTYMRDLASGAPLQPLNYRVRPEKVYEVSAINPLRLATDLRQLLRRRRSVERLSSPPTDGSQRPGTASWRFRAGRAVQQVLVPDEYAHWISRAVTAGKQIIEREKPLAIWAFFPHATNLVAAYRLSRATGLPLMLDFRDPWTGFVSWGSVPWWRARIEERIERRILEHATAVTVVNEGVTEDLVRKVPSVSTKVHQLPQGIDLEEAAFIGAGDHSANGTLRIGYGGTLSRGLGDPEAFLRALGNVVARRETNTPLQVIFVGQSALDLREMARSAGVAEMVTVLGHCERYESLRVLAGCDQLLLINERSGKVWITGKIWDYLTLGRPILGIVDPESAAASVLRSTNTGTVAPPWDDARIEAEIERTLEEFERYGKLCFHPDEEAVRSLSMESVAREAARILELIV